jgi:hypothetical protein
MNPKLRHLNAVAAKSQATERVIQVVGGDLPGYPRTRVQVGRYIIVGCLPNLPVEDDGAHSDDVGVNPKAGENAA